MNKISMRFFDDREVRAVWDDAHSKCWFSVLDNVLNLALIFKAKRVSGKRPW
ncbi:MAG: hypothetical protein LBG65_08360 [Puniceicoccales bacterium]|nr:hypothetical protein [Puniceicoccales bacterium]